MAELQKNPWISDKLSEEKIKEEIEKKNLLPYFGITPEVLEKIKSPSLENLCEAIKTVQIPYEVLISQNPIEDIAMYLTIFDMNKNNKEVPETVSKLVGKIREFYWKNKDFSELSSVLEYPLKVLPRDLHEKRLESLPKQILEELNEAILFSYTPSKGNCTREQAIHTIQDNLYKIYKQNNQF